MQSAALLWQIYALTHSKYALGYIGLARVIPLVLFALVGGVVADALDRRRLMLLSQSLMALLATALGVWSLLGMREVWPIYVVAGLSSGVLAFDNPARQSLMPTLVPRERLANALSLNSICIQTASIVGPALTGLVILKLGDRGVGWVYLLNGLSFLAVIVALLRMSPPRADEVEARPKVSLEAALEGLRFMRHSHLLVSLMLLDFLATFFSSADTLLPVYARDILRVGPGGYGVLAGAAAVGSLVGAGALAWLPPIRRQGRVVLGAVFCYGLATILFGVGKSFPICFLGLAGTGMADTVSTVLRQTIRQLVTPDALRGRMTSINLIFLQGGPQLGEVEAGLVAGAFGAPASVISGGIACLLMVIGMAAFAPALRRHVAEE
jgi:MFS family permease